MAFAQHHHRSQQQQQQQQHDEREQQQQGQHSRSSSSGNHHHPLLMKTDALQPNSQLQQKRRQRKSAADAALASSHPSSGDPMAVAGVEHHQQQGQANSSSDPVSASASASAHDWTLVFPGRQHSSLSSQDPFLADEHHPLPTSPSAILNFPQASDTQHGLGLLPERDYTHFSTSSLAWSLPTASSEVDHRQHQRQGQGQEEEEQQHRTQRATRSYSNASSSVLSLSSSSFTSSGNDPIGANGASQSFSLVDPPSPSAVSAGGTGSVNLRRAESRSSPTAARDRTGSSTYSAAEGSGELLHLPAPPSTEAGASSSPPPKNNKNRRRRKARTGATTPAGSAEHGVVEDGTGSRVTSSSEDSDDQDGRSSKRSNNSGSAAIRRRTARKNGRAAAAGGVGGQAGANATPAGQGSRLQLRGDGITVLRPTTSSSSSAAANNKQSASEESTEEGKLARRPPSASTRLISAILRKLFTLEPDVLDAFLLGSETHVLGHSNAAPQQQSQQQQLEGTVLQHQNVRTSGRDSNASGGARSVSNSSTTASSRPRRTVRFAELGGGASGEAESVRPYEYEYRTFAAAYQQQQRKSSSRSRSSEGKTGLGSASETVSSNPILAIARAEERAEAGENEDEEDGDGDEADEVGLVKIDPEGKLATRRPRSTTTGNADGSSGGAFEHPYKQTRRSSSAGEHDENDEANTPSASFQPVRRNASSTSLTSSTRPRTTYSDSSSAIVGGGAGGGATMMEPTAWEAIRALFDERLARQAYSFHEGIGLPLSLRLLRWVLGRSGVWAGGAGGANKGRRGTRAAVVAGIGWDGIEEMLDGDEEEDEEEGRTEDGLFSSEVGDFARLVGGEAALFGGDVAAAATETGGGASSLGESEAVKRERERREWERAWARGVALASAAAHASASTEPSEVGEDARHGSLSPPLGYHARSYSAYDLSHYPPQDGYYNPAAVNVGVGGDGAEYLNPPHVAGRSSWAGGGNRALAHFHHQQQQQGGGTYPSHFASYGDLPAIAASIESSFGGPSFHEARQHHSPTSSAVSSSLPSPSALELGLGTAGLGGAVQFRPTVGGPTVAAARGGLGLLESDDGENADEEGSTGRRYSRRVVG